MVVIRALSVLNQKPFVAMKTLNSRLQLALLNRQKSRSALEKGFTLVELMVVIIIVGVLSAVALPNFLDQTNKAKATECTSKGGAIMRSWADALSSIAAAEDTLADLVASNNTNSEICEFTAGDTPAVDADQTTQ